MKKLITLLICLSSFLGQTMAQPDGPDASFNRGSFTREDYSFMYLGGTEIKTYESNGSTYLRSIGNSGNYASDYSWEWRFRIDDPTTAWTQDNGNFGGLKNTSGSDKHFYICNLKAGDRLYIETAANDNSPLGVWFVPTRDVSLVDDVDANGVPYPVSTTQTVTTTDGDGNTYTEEVTTVTTFFGANPWPKVTRKNTYYINNDCDVALVVNSGDNTRIQRVVIDSWHEAQYKVEDVYDNDGHKGERFYFTSAGVLKDKHPAVPFLTVQFGSDNYKTYIQRYSGLGVAASSYNNANQTYNTFEYVQGEGTLPNGGSYVYFFPDVDGTLSFKGRIENSSKDERIYFIKNIHGSDGNAVLKSYPENDNDITNGNIELNNIELKAGEQYYLSSHGSYPNQHPVFHLSEFTFIPDAKNYTGELSYVMTTAQKNTAIGEGSVSFTLNNSYNTAVVKKYLGNIESANVSVSGNQLTVSGVSFKAQDTDGKEANKGGVILVYINPVYSGGNIDRKSPVVAITIPYGAEDYANKDSKQIKVWNFNKNSLSLGKSTDTSSLLYQEMHYSDGSTDWVFDNLNHYKDEEPVFKSVYDMEGDNADMIEETEGLIFNTPTNNLCIYNEKDPNPTAFVDRYVGFRPGGKLTIPQLKKGDRVRLLIGRYGGPNANEANAYLRLTNAKDVSLNVTDNSNGTQTVTEGILIEGDYVIGGAQSRADRNEIYGEYNFIVDHNGDFVLEMTQGQLIKFYRIEIYKSDKFFTTNGVLRTGANSSANVYELVYTDEDSANKNLSYLLHNYGKGERIKVLNVDQINGNLSGLSRNSFIENDPGQATSVYFTPQKGQFGSFRLTLGVKTQNGTYITDRADRMMAVGYLQKMSYPYTWDFTILEETQRINLNDYSDYGPEHYVTNAINQEMAASNIEDDKNLWEQTSGFGLRMGDTETSSTGDPARGILFASGGQLYAQNTMFEETAGIGFKRSLSDFDFDNIKHLNAAVAIADGGLRLRATKDANTFVKMVIPKVPAGAVIYVKAQPIEDTSYPKYQYSIDKTNGIDFTKVITGLGKQKKDKVYIMKNDTERDVELWLNGLVIQKIGISEDEKYIGPTGFATESRTRKIDHRLTAEFTGLPIKAYIVKGLGDIIDDYSRAVEVKDVAVLQENQGCFIANDMLAPYEEGENKSVDILDGKAHLFVPAIHNMDESTNYDNLMVPNIAGHNIDAQENGKINYALSNKHFTNPNKPVYGKVNFYRVAEGGATSPKNSAYLQIGGGPAAGVKAFYIMLEGAEEPLAEDFGDQDITAVKGIENAEAIEGNWYNMNGQKLNGRPTSSGIYVVNGKKVVIK